MPKQIITSLANSICLIYSGGLSNLLYMCSLELENFPENCEQPLKVMLRLYGQIIQDSPETVVTDSVIFAMLSEQQLGPKLYGVFTGGRVEEYIPVSFQRVKEYISVSFQRVKEYIPVSFYLGKFQNVNKYILVNFYTLE